MVEREVVLINPTGLHARPAAQFVHAAEQFETTRIWVRKGDRQVDGRSILGILSLGATQGTRIVIGAEGEAEDEAVETLVKLVKSGLGECG